MKRIFILILLAGAALSAQTKTEDERWMLIDMSPDYKNAVYVDTQTVRRDGDTVVVWEKLTLKDGSRIVYREQIRRDRISRSLNCFSYNANGDVTYSSRTAGEWQESVPGSLQDSVNTEFPRWMRMAAAKETPTVRY